jgi:hypothetical protein
MAQTPRTKKELDDLRFFFILHKFHGLATANKHSSTSHNNLNRVPTYSANIKFVNISHSFTSTDSMYGNQDELYYSQAFFKLLTITETTQCFHHQIFVNKFHLVSI